MKKLDYSIQIAAPASSVYHAVTDKQAYSQWTTVFDPSSRFDGSWEKGAKISFTAVTPEGKRMGMVANIIENIPNKQISIRHYGLIDGDTEISEGPAVEGWQGAMEEYFFEEENGHTVFKVFVDTHPDYIEFFNTAWPEALRKLKELSEAQVAKA